MSGREEIEKMKTLDAAAAAAVEEVRDIAKSYYDSATPQVKEQAELFFNSMDLDGNREINLVEFLSFMRQQGYYKKMQNNSFFEMLDISGRGTLAFMDVITLYYIIKSGRPFCHSCHRFIPGTFFSCVECFNQLGDSFTVCTSCHLNTNNKYHHKHDGRSALFLDNFTLLQATKPHLPITTTTNQEAAHTEPPDVLLSSTTETQQPLLLMGKGDSVSTSTSTSEKKHANSEAANTGISITAKTQQPLLLGKGDSASTSTSTSKNGDMKSKSAASVTVTPAKSVAKTSTPSARIKSSHDRNAIVPAIKPAASISTSTSTSTSTSENDYITSHLTDELYRVVREQTQSPPPSQPQSPSPLVNQLPNVKVNKIESTTSTPNTICVRPPNQQVTWMKAASVALKALDAMVAIGSIAGAVSACTIM
ncbi:serine-rich adhesin for platelets-like isoform X2 [Salvia splendens]|uniref:serine-rich adhesin for platelets-like isoform X2 n=1 Tax=Salvia splendens TaxID=180675 RepID=UPI001C271B85|nr:serine-rich adhesin for platelets-like isoform X2 [Salvia splendens]